MPAPAARSGANRPFGRHRAASWLGWDFQRQLLARIQGNYDAFVTVDKNLPAQQKTSELSFDVIVLRAPSNKLDDLKPLVPQMLAALDSLQPGQVVLVPSA